MTGWWGIDVGGANLKWVDHRGIAHSRCFPLWQRPHDLAEELANRLQEMPANCGVAATMTGELCDCFETKGEGVRHIVAALSTACRSHPVSLYGVDGEFHSPEQILARPHLAAASNWHALASFAAAWLPEGTGLVIDIGSTTTDIIPVSRGRVATSSRSDTDRLRAGELIYCGVGRTPLMALVSTLPYRGANCPVAAEVFATTADVYFLLGDTNSDPAAEPRGTADGRPMTRRFAIDRLARSICADRTTFTEADALTAAEYVKQQQLARLRQGLQQVIESHPECAGNVVTAGEGETLAKDLWNESKRGSTESLRQRVGPEASQAAGALAVAVLRQRYHTIGSRL